MNGIRDAGSVTTAFVAKYSPTDTLVWVSVFPPEPGPPELEAASRGKGIAVDNLTGAIYVVGTYSGTIDFPSVDQTVVLINNDSFEDGFIVKLTPDGIVDQGLVRSFGDDLGTVVNNVTLSGNGSSVYVTGGFVGTANSSTRFSDARD